MSEIVLFKFGITNSKVKQKDSIELLATAWRGGWDMVSPIVSPNCSRIDCLEPEAMCIFKVSDISSALKSERQGIKKAFNRVTLHGRNNSTDKPISLDLFI